MKALRIIILYIPVILISNRLNAGPELTTKTLDLPSFHSVYVNSAYTVYIKQTNKQEVNVEALTEIFEISEFKVEDGILHVNIKRKPNSNNKSLWAKIDDIKISPTLNLRISMKDVKELRVNGNGKIIGENSVASPVLNLGVAGSGSLNIDIKGKEVKTNISGSGNVELKGYATENKIDMSGSGSLLAFNCELESAKVVVSGDGSCEINVSDNLEAKVYGSGTVKHKGTTKKVVKKEYGRGEIARAY
ncbi:MAG: head GIN domain-containing protein [Bacteroidota bacterium]